VLEDRKPPGAAPVVIVAEPRSNASRLGHENEGRKRQSYSPLAALKKPQRQPLVSQDLGLYPSTGAIGDRIGPDGMMRDILIYGLQNGTNHSVAEPRKLLISSCC